MPGGELRAPAPLAGFIIRYGPSYSAFGVASPFLPSFIVVAEVEVLFLIEPWLLSVLTPAGAIASPHRQVLPVARGGFDRGLAALTLTQPLHGITFALLQPACMRLLVANVPSQLAGCISFLSVLCRRMPKLQGSSTILMNPEIGSGAHTESRE
jgi:hypothetical protein